VSASRENWHWQWPSTCPHQANDRDSIERIDRTGQRARAVKDVVGDAIKPVATELDKLAREVRGQEAAEETLAQMTKKGNSWTY
jgi:hypothetical protein